MLFFSDGPDGKKNCCCGCSLACGVITFAVLAGLQAISDAVSGMWPAAVVDAVLCLVGVLAVTSKESATMAVVNWYLNLIGAVLYCIAIVLVAIFGTALVKAACDGLTGDEADACNAATGYIWIAVLGMVLVGGPIVYLACGIAYYYVAEKKAEVDSGYQKA